MLRNQEKKKLSGSGSIFILSRIVSLKKEFFIPHKENKVATVTRSSAVKRSGQRISATHFYNNQGKESTTGFKTSKPLDTVQRSEGNPVKMHWKFKDNHTLGMFNLLFLFLPGEFHSVDHWSILGTVNKSERERK